MTHYSCNTTQLQEVVDLTGDQNLANQVCTSFNVTDLGATAAVMHFYGAHINQSVVSEEGLNIMILCISGYLVFMMQAGFAMVCAGAVRSQHALDILMKNILDACIGTFGWYLVGFAFAYGSTSNPNGFIGNSDFALSDTTSDARGNFKPNGGWHFFFFEWAFCAAAATIVSGAVAERCAFAVYVGYSFFISSFVYPVVVHWLWSPYGWLSALNSDPLLGIGAVDFAGSGVVHMVGGFSALMGSSILGPRIGRFTGDGKEFKGHSVTLQALGTFLLWFGWYGFNPGSQLLFLGGGGEIAARVAVITTLGAASGALGGLVSGFVWYKNYNVPLVCNGILAGLVSVTAGCSVIEPWAAIIAGFFGGVIFMLLEILILYLKIDDPVSAAPLHAGCGMWGVFFVGLLAREDYLLQVYPSHEKGSNIEGIFYGGHGQLLLCQFIEILAIAGWTCFWMGGFFLLMKLLNLLRVIPEVELGGIDTHTHGGPAYHENTTNEFFAEPVRAYNTKPSIFSLAKS